MIKISVIVPVYNSEKYLEECLDSLVYQTIDEIEIVIVNDGSTDGSKAIIDQYQSRFPGKVVAYDKENGGQASARNYGISKCNGEYIGFMDSDDSADLDMFRSMYEKAEKENLDYVECGYKYLQVYDGGKKKELPRYGDVRERSDKKDMFINPLVSPWNKIYRARIIKNCGIIFPEGLIYEDTSFYLKAIPSVNRMGYISKDYVNHYLRTNSTMNAQKDERVGNIFAVLQDAIDFYQDNGLWKEYKEELEYFCVKLLLCSSFMRIAKVSDCKKKQEYVRKTFCMIEQYFPMFKKNKHINRGTLGLYLRNVRPYNANIVLFVMKHVR